MNIPQGQNDSLLKTPKSEKNFTNTVSSSVNSTVNSIKNNSKQLYNNSIQSIKSFSNRPETIVGLVIVILLALIIAYVMYNYIANTLFNQSKIIVEATKLPVVCNIQNKFEIDRKLPSGNGLKRTYTFWIYIKDMSHQYFKNVLYIGSTDKVKERSPQIFMDRQKNKLFIRFAKKYQDKSDYAGASNVSWGTDGGGKSIETLFQDADGAGGPYTDNFRRYMEQGVCIEYVPIQRWVHIGIVVNDFGTSTGGNITTYVDGDLVGVAGHDEELRGVGDETDSSYKYNITDLDLDKNDNLVIGGSHNEDGSPGFSGLICKFTMFNYDLNDRDIHNDYVEGPIDNFMAKLGLGAYGLRSPVYKLA